jgi:squalene cyclase
VLGTTALSQAVPAQAVQFLEAAQWPAGGWEWDAGWGEDTNSTALAIQALAAAGEPAGSSAVLKGLNYLDAAQNDDGGFPYSPTSPWGTDSDANSTAYVVQALLAVGQSPSAARWSTHTQGITPTNPISYLLSVQLADGSFEWQAGSGSNASATRQAIPALLGRPFPLQATDLASCPARYLPLVRKGSS